MKRGTFSFWMIFIVFVCVLGYLQPFDDTDNEQERERSGLVLYIDYGTGCEYVKGGLLGGITPRLNGNGDQLGCRR